MSLKKFLIVFTIFITLISCQTERIVYRDPPPPIDNPIPEKPVLDQSEALTPNIYALLIYSYRLKLWAHKFRRDVKIISDDEYTKLFNKYNAIIDDINKEINKLKE